MDILLTEGINAKGFGTIPKLIMTDKKLTIKAKAIYAYFCSYAGGGSQAFPSVEKIQYDLGIGDKAYYKHFKYLKAYGCIKAEKRARNNGKFLGNIYTLNVQLVPEKELVEEIECKEYEDILITDGIFSKGFGTISKIVMLDKRLTIQSKAIYAYFCSYAGGGSQPFPSVRKIIADLDIGEETYYKHVKLLKVYGYISVEQRKGATGRFTSSIYTLNSHPVPIVCENAADEIKNIGTYQDNNHCDDVQKPYRQNQGTAVNIQKPCMQKPCTEKAGTNINNNSFNINKALITTTENNPKTVVVVPDTKLKVGELKNEIDKAIGGCINLKVLAELVQDQGIEKIKYCIDNWSGIIGSQTIQSVERFFVKAVKEGYKALTPVVGKGGNLPSNRTNFEERDYGDDYFEGFFSNVR